MQIIMLIVYASPSRTTYSLTTTSNLWTRVLLYHPVECQPQQPVD